MWCTIDLWRMTLDLVTPTHPHTHTYTQKHERNRVETSAHKSSIQTTRSTCFYRTILMSKKSWNSRIYILAHDDISLLLSPGLKANIFPLLVLLLAKACRKARAFVTLFARKNMCILIVLVNHYVYPPLNSFPYAMKLQYV